MGYNNYGNDNKDDSVKLERGSSSLTNDFGVPVKAKKSRILIIYVLLSIILICAVTFYEVKSNSSLDSKDGIYVTRKITLKENEDYIIKVDEELNGKLVFESTDHAIADVTSDGLIKGGKTGKALIIIRDEDNKTLRTININVVKKSSKIKSDSNTNGVITENVSSDDNNDDNLNNESDDNSNNNVNTENTNSNNTVIENNNSNNNNSSNNNGNNETSNNNISNDTEDVIKEVLVEDIVLDKSDITLFLNESITINASVVPDNAINKDLVWSSNDSNIATVNNGVVKGLKIGKTTINIKASNGIEKKCSIEVKEKPSTVVNANSITLSDSSKSIKVGSSIKLSHTISPANTTNKTVTWSSSNKTVATVNNGVVKGIKAGTATITVKTSNGKTATCKITVKNVNATGVTLNTTSTNVEVGNTVKLVATVSPSNTTNKTITWTSSDTSIATVSKGVVKGIKTGTVTITAKTTNGKTATCSVVVKAKTVNVTKVTINNTSANLLVGGTVNLTATVSPSNATNKTITWTSSNTSVAVVNSSGKVTAKGKGSTIITATSSNGKTATSKIIVQKNGDYIIFPQLTGRAEDSTIIQSNGKFAMIDTFSNEDNQCYSLKKYLKDNNIYELDFLIITHFHRDHSGCVYSLVNGSKVDGETYKLKINKILYKPINPNCNWQADTYHYNKIVSTGVPMVAQTKNSSFKWNNFTFHIYNTEQRVQTNCTKFNSNFESLVVSVKNNYHSSLIAGDIRQFEKNHYFEEIAGEVGHVEIYKAAHHGLDNNNPKEAMKVLTPSYVVITNKHDHDQVPPFLDRIKKSPLNISDDNIFWTEDYTYIFDVTNTKMKIKSCKVGVDC